MTGITGSACCAPRRLPRHASEVAVRAGGGKPQSRVGRDSGSEMIRRRLCGLPPAYPPPYDGDEQERRHLVLVLGLVESLLLVARGFLLVLGLPLVVRHAVDDLARLGIGDLDALLARLLAVPARQAVAAEAGQIHQVDVLHVRALLQMRDQAAEGGGFELGAGLVVHGVLLERRVRGYGSAGSIDQPSRERTL